VAQFRFGAAVFGIRLADTADAGSDLFDIRFRKLSHFRYKERSKLYAGTSLCCSRRDFLATDQHPEASRMCLSPTSCSGENPGKYCVTALPEKSPTSVCRSEAA